MKPETVIHLHRIDRSQNMARFYRLSVAPSLFGDICLVREWGRIGRPGRMRIDLYAAPEEATAARAMLERAKRRRGYCDAGELRVILEARSDKTGKRAIMRQPVSLL